MAMLSNVSLENEPIIPTQDELEKWLAFIGEKLNKYLPPHNPRWLEFMLSCYIVACLAPDKHDLFALGGRIFYKIVKNHRLADGNKRSAVICTALFFLKNGIRLTLSADEMYELARVVAESQDSDEIWAKRLRELFTVRRAID